MSQHFPAKPMTPRGATTALRWRLHRVMLLVLLLWPAASNGWETHAFAAAPPDDPRTLQDAAEFAWIALERGAIKPTNQFAGDRHDAASRLAGGDIKID